MRKDAVFMIRCKPERNPKQTLFMLLSFISLALLTGLFCVYADSVGIPQVIPQALFAAVVLVALYYMIRYSLTEIEYELGADTLTVIKTTGRRRVVAGTLDLAETLAFIPKSEFKKNKSRYGNIDKSFNYRQNPTGESMIYIFRFSGLIAMIDFEPNAPFVEAMRDNIDSCRKDSEEDSL